MKIAAKEEGFFYGKNLLATETINLSISHHINLLPHESLIIAVGYNDM